MNHLTKRYIKFFVIIIIIFACIGCLWLFAKYARISDTMSGTFRNEDFPNYEYVVIDDNHYLQYKEDEIIAEGTVTSVDEIIYVKYNNLTICAVYSDYKLYVFHSDEIQVFEKMSDIPTYINIDSEL